MVQPEEVLVLRNCVLNDPDHRAIEPPCEEGDVVTIAGGEYAGWLIENGFVVPVSEVPALVKKADTDLNDLDRLIAEASGGTALVSEDSPELIKLPDGTTLVPETIAKPIVSPPNSSRRTQKLK